MGEQTSAARSSPEHDGRPPAGSAPLAVVTGGTVQGRPVGLAPTSRKPPDARPRPVPPEAHLVGYAHLDPVWLWNWTEGYAEARATLRSAVDRLNEYPEFVFTATSVQFLDWVRESDPELFDEIAGLVATGRFHVAGGWWVEPDCNIPSGEAFVRHALYGQRFLARHFGVIATVGGNPDSFGHAATLPQLLAGAGLTGYFFSRPNPTELELPAGPFRWEGPDGSQVVAYRSNGYSSERADVSDHLRRSLLAAGDEPSLMVFYGVGNHGGGPTRANLDSIRRLAATSSDARLLCASPRSYLDGLDPEQLPVHRGELQHHARGCYAAHAGIKAWNRRAETALGDAERWATVAHATCGLPYPQDPLEHAWRLLLLNQFHDTLAGSAIPSAYDDARNQLGEVLAIAQRATNAAAARLTARLHIPAEPDMQPIAVFNPHSWPVRQVVEYEVGGWARRQNLVDEAGAAVPLQWGESEATMPEGRYRAVFVADLPAGGHRLYRLGVGPTGCEAPPEPGVHDVLENDHLRARIDPVTGGLASLVDRSTGLELAAPGPHAVVLVDDADTWGHRHDGWHDQAGRFVVERVERVEHGPARSVVRVTSRWGASTMVADWRLGVDDRWIDVAVVVDWHERHRMLKLRFPTRVARSTVTAEVAYGAVTRAAQGDEEPMQRWVDVSGAVDGAPAGLAVCNDGKYAYDARGGDGPVDVGITVARSVPYAYHEPAVLTPGANYRYLDLGEQRFTLRLVPHAGDWRAAAVPRRAAELNAPPLCQRDTYHDGSPDTAASLWEVVGDHVVVGALKRAEDGGATILRLAEQHGVGGSAEVHLRFAGCTISVLLRPWEVRTLRVPDDPDAPVEDVDLCEWAEGGRPPGQPLPDGRIPLPARDHGSAR